MTFKFFDIGIVGNCRCHSPYREFILILYIGSIFRGLNTRTNHNTIPPQWHLPPLALWLTFPRMMRSLWWPGGMSRFARSPVLSILLSRRTKNKEWCILCKRSQQAWRDSLYENYELSLRLTNEVTTNGSEYVYWVGFYTISYVWGCGVKVSTLMPEKDPTSCTRVNVQDVSCNSSPYTPIQVC